MAVRYDRNADRLHLAVGDLLYVERVRDPRIAGDLASRSELGRDLHILHGEKRAERFDDFRSEVEVTWSGSLDGAEIVLHGRIDGIWQGDDTAIVEELKSTFANSSLLPYPSHQMQLLIYLAMLDKQGTTAVGQLCYLHPITRAESLFSTHLEEVTWAELERRMQAILNWHRRETERLEARKATANRIRWPYPEKRPGQEVMEAEVESALTSGQHALISAPTGSGKTAPVLLTAFRHSCKHGKRLAFATSRTAQQQSRGELLCEAADAEARGRMLILTAQEKLLDGFDLPEEASLPFDPWDPPEWFLEWLDRGIVLDGEAVRDVALAHQVDPVQLQREAMRYADVLIGDMNLLAMPAPGTRSPMGRVRTSREEILLIDEAHGLPDRLRDQRAATLAPEELKRLAEELRDHPSPLTGELASVVEEIVGLLAEMLHPEEDNEGLPIYDRVDPADPILQPHFLHALELISSTLHDSLPEQQRESLYQLQRAITAASQPSGYAAYLDRMNGTWCCELAETGQVLSILSEWYSSVIAFSATLDPLEIAREELGLPVAHSRLVRLPDPYGRDQRLVLRYAGIDTTWARREETAPTLADLLSGCVKATGGNWLVFLPSRAYLELLNRHLATRSTPALALRPGMPPSLMKRLTEGSTSALHLALMGGTLAEGMDLLEGGYRGLAIVSIGLPPPSPRAELMRVVTEERGESGLLKAYLLPGLRRVQQAAGRLIRGPEQRGALLLIDPRFTRPDIESLMPDGWREAEVHDDPTILHNLLADWTHRP
ncbi:PD-(D/E)XK nuclease family protein [bacterium]|nr:PD-(D/E)XK nuclease family protein [bacterium]